MQQSLHKLDIRAQVKFPSTTNADRSFHAAMRLRRELKAGTFTAEIRNTRTPLFSCFATRLP